MAGKLKIGVFGAHRGMTMMRVLANHPDAVLVAVCDKYVPLLDKTRELAAKYGLDVACYERFDDFFEHDMDAVVCANYANEHSVFGVKLLRSGRHILSEVLPCETMAQAVELIETVEETGLVYAYAENYCYMRHAFEMQHRYEAGEIGEVTYCEGEYVHDCSSIWPQITYGEPDHWRNRLYSTYYCTHSIGPMMTITGRRPVQVVGFETPVQKDIVMLGGQGGLACGGLEIITFDNGAIAKSIHGGLKREPGSIYYEIYGTKGMMESDRFDSSKVHVYKESDKLCVGEFEHYEPKPRVAAELVSSSAVQGHFGSDFYATHFFIQKILGREEGHKYSIDVYKAVDMGICGILAYRSILAGNVPIKVPNFRNKDERDAYRNDNACTNPAIAGDALLPCTSQGEFEIPPEAYEYVRNLWLEGKYAEKPYGAE